MKAIETEMKVSLGLDASGLVESLRQMGVEFERIGRAMRDGAERLAWTPPTASPEWYASLSGGTLPVLVAMAESRREWLRQAEAYKARRQQWLDELDALQTEIASR